MEITTIKTKYGVDVENLITTLTDEICNVRTNGVREEATNGVVCNREQEAEQRS